MQMFYLGRKGEPLFYAQFEAWQYGPVEPFVYERFAVFVARPISELYFFEHGVPKEAPEMDFIREMLKILLFRSASFLVNFTHSEKGAWKKCYVKNKKIRIPNQAIIDEYSQH